MLSFHGEASKSGIHNSTFQNQISNHSKICVQIKHFNFSGYSSFENRSKSLFQPFFWDKTPVDIEGRLSHDFVGPSKKLNDSEELEAFPFMYAYICIYLFI